MWNLSCVISYILLPYILLYLLEAIDLLHYKIIAEEAWLAKSFSLLQLLSTYTRDTGCIIYYGAVVVCWLIYWLANLVLCQPWLYQLTISALLPSSAELYIPVCKSALHQMYTEMYIEMYIVCSVHTCIFLTMILTLILPPSSWPSGCRLP